MIKLIVVNKMFWEGCCHINYDRSFGTTKVRLESDEL